MRSPLDHESYVSNFTHAYSFKSAILNLTRSENYKVYKNQAKTKFSSAKSFVLLSNLQFEKYCNCVSLKRVLNSIYVIL